MAALSIGDFSRMTFLTVKQLRNYHELGLLEPAWVDPQSGYRYYTVDQVPSAQVIRRFRDLGMPLDDLRSVLEAPDVATRNAVLVGHLERMEASLRETRATVTSLRNLLAHGPSRIPVSYMQRSYTSALAIVDAPDESGLTAWRTAAFESLHDEARRQLIVPIGPDGALYPPELLESGSGLVTAFVPVAGRPQDGGRVRAIELPAAEFAVAVHRGALEDLDQTFARLGAAVAERAIGIDGPIQENYLDPQTIEVCWPVFQTSPGAGPQSP